MPWVEFLDDWDERTSKRSMRSHKAMSRAMLTRAQANEAVESGKARRIAKPKDLKAGKNGQTEQTT